MARIDATKDYYRILELTVVASQDAIRAAHRELARQYHPDSGGGDIERFRMVQEAYQVLSDLALRRSYDRQREQRGVGAGPVALTLLQSRDEMLPLDSQQILYLFAEIRPQEGLQGPRKRLNIALVIDRSTSMHGARIHNVKSAAFDLLESLQADDRLAVVTFSDHAEVVVASQYARDKRALRSAIASIAAGGGTEIRKGLTAGVEQVTPYVSDDTITHVILLTDGCTYGDEEQALSAATRAEAAGIGISAFGIGEDWNDVFLDSLARRGGGTSQYVDTPSKVRNVLRAQIRDLNSLVLKGLSARVGTAPGVEVQAAYRVLPHMEALPIKADHVLNLGNVLVGESCAIVLELVVRNAEGGLHRLARLAVEARSTASAGHVELWRDIEVTFTSDIQDKPVPPRLLDVLARLSVFRLQEQAWQALELGDARQATRCLESAATQLFDLGYQDLGRAAMLEVDRLDHGNGPTIKGRKKLRYGTRALSIPTS
ncbi:MAG: VWA domain-containing protein [Anaerolineae bacterium]|nr:VWA domain-containing protein [Anaerolineae bacterium]